MDNVIAVAGTFGLAALLASIGIRIYVTGYRDALRDLSERRPEPWWMRHVR